MPIRYLCVCSALGTNHSVAPLPSLRNSFTSTVFSIIMFAPTDETLHRLQLGCTDCFAKALCSQVSRQFRPSGTASLSEYPQPQSAAALDDITSQMSTFPLTKAFPSISPTQNCMSSWRPGSRAVATLLPRLLRSMDCSTERACSSNILSMASQQLLLLGSAQAFATAITVAIPDFARREGASC